MPTTSAIRFLSALLAALAIARAGALEPDELLLLVNSNVPEGARLAEIYSGGRQIPPDRTFALALPVGDEIPFNLYETKVVPAVRAYLRDQGLRDKVRSIVCFYGMPLRIGDRQLTADERQELADLQAELASQTEAVRLVLGRLERQAQQADPAFNPLVGSDTIHLEQRSRQALGVLVRQAAVETDLAVRRQRSEELVTYLRELGGPAEVLRTFGTAAPESPAAAAETELAIRGALADIAHLQELRWDAAARLDLRKKVALAFGRLDLLRILQAQIDYLKPDATHASLDSELSLLWSDYYPRSSWVANPLYYQRPATGGAPLLLTARLDAPQSGDVRQMILSYIKAERDGLPGRVVLDSRNIRTDVDKVGSYGWYDQSLRNLATLIREKTTLRLLHDESPEVLPAGSAREVALYCGWYRVRNYVPTCQFSIGAVGFHVASFELVSLRAPEEKGWCRGLLNDGIAATLGPVAEPYLIAFPAADDFFPLLLTGQVSLGEAFWHTIPVTSWQMSLVGDPLYRPFKANPALKPADLPERLQGILAGPATRPTTQPASRPAAPPANPAR